MKVQRKGGDAYGGQVDVYAYHIGNLKGTEVQKEHEWSTQPGALYTLNLNAHPNGLYRIKVLCQYPMTPYTIEITGAQYYCVESVEPCATFNILGNAAHSGLEPGEDGRIRQYLFVPKDAGTIYVKLQTDHGGDRAGLKFYRDGDDPETDEPRLKLVCKGDAAASDSDNANFAEGSVTLPTPPLQASGDICFFELYRIANDGTEDTTKQPEGIVWVRFSRNVPNYDAFDKERLMVPVVHPHYHNGFYTGASPIHKAFLCGDRTNLEDYQNANLQIKVGSASGSSNTYSVAVSPQSGSPDKWTTDSGDLYARLFRSGYTALEGTDQIDRVVVVRPPTYTISGEPDWEYYWPNPVYLAFSDENALDRIHVYQDGTTWDNYNDDKIAMPNQGLKTRNFHCVVMSLADKLQYLNNVETDDGWEMKAAGATFAGDFSGHWSDPNVLLWWMRDEPFGFGAIGGKRLWELYDEYYEKCGLADPRRPIMINLDYAFLFEDCVQAMDILCSDPYTDVPGIGRNKYVIKDYVTAAKQARTNEGVSCKKIALVIWGFYPPNHLQSTTRFGQDHDKAKEDSEVDIIGMYTYCSGAASNYKRLAQQGQGGAELWDTIDSKNVHR